MSVSEPTPDKIPTVQVEWGERAFGNGADDSRTLMLFVQDQQA